MDPILYALFWTIILIIPAGMALADYATYRPGKARGWLALFVAILTLAVIITWILMQYFGFTWESTTTVVVTPQ